jgi:hypothetical protein
MTARHCCETAGSALPTVLLAILPKCPACLAAWFATAAGLGISTAAAARLHTLLIALCLAAPLYLLGRALLKVRTPRDIVRVREFRQARQ